MSLNPVAYHDSQLTLSCDYRRMTSTFQGCKDTQTSADASEAGQATGAMSWAFISALTKYPQQSYIQLLNTIRDELRTKYSQKPQLSSSHPMDTNLLYVM